MMGALAGKVIGNKLGQKGQEQSPVPDQYPDVADFFKKIQQDSLAKPQVGTSNVRNAPQFSLLK
jgi:hypothetical protein